MRKATGSNASGEDRAGNYRFARIVRGFLNRVS
jgi:hypothetical protein